MKEKLPIAGGGNSGAGAEKKLKHWLFAWKVFEIFCM